MKLSNRLASLENYKPKIIYPSFADRYETQTPEAYNQWLLDHNVGLTQAMITERAIKHLNDMY